MRLLACITLEIIMNDVHFRVWPPLLYSLTIMPLCRGARFFQWERGGGGEWTRTPTLSSLPQKVFVNFA